MAACAQAVAKLLAFSLLFLIPVGVQAALLKFVGNVGYSYGGNTAVLAADEIRNYDAGGTSSSSMKMELWAFPAPYTGAPQNGYKMAEFPMGPLPGSTSYANVYSGQIPFTYPPNGSWNVSMLLTELTGAADNGGYTARDWGNFADRLVVGQAPPSLTPYVGSWWNPNESGTGYSIDYRHGTLVVTTYSFLATGQAQWYISVGQLNGNTFTATLDKSVGGQCISCPYRPITMAGNDGTMTIVFQSATSATVFLPGGRSTQIVPLAF